MLNTPQFRLKFAFIEGLKHIVLDEISQYVEARILKEHKDSFCLNLTPDINWVKRLRSVSRIYLVAQDARYNPLYISKHKKIIDDIVTIIINDYKKEFKTFSITCAGSDSIEVIDLSKYIGNKYRLTKSKKADLKIHIIKLGVIWEVGAQITSRPPSFRDYKVSNISGAIDPTIAYAMNSLCNLNIADSYLNIFSGSATLLIEAALTFPIINRLVGFDYNKKHISMAIQNIKKANLIRKIQLKEIDIFENPNLVERFDAITSDLPFGMKISKSENLDKLYRRFVELSQLLLKPTGILVVITSEYELMRKILDKSNFYVVSGIDLKLISSVGAYLRPKIFVCKLK